MDRCSGKRGTGGSVTPRKTYSSTAFKEAAASEGNHSAQFCNRIGCSGRMKFSQSARMKISDKSKYSKPSFRPSSGNEVTGESSTSNSAVTTAQRPCLDSNRKIFAPVTSDPPVSKVSNESGDQGVVSSPSKLNGYRSEPMARSREVNMAETGSSGASTGVGPRKTFCCKSGSCNQHSSAASAAASSSKSSAFEPFNRINGSRYGLRSLRCSSISDATPASCSPLESVSVRKNFYKKRSSEGESSSSTGGRKSTSAPNVDRHTSPTTTGVTISDSALSSSTLVEDGSGSSSAWTRRSTNVNARMRFSSQKDGRNSSSVRNPAVSFTRNEYEIPSTVRNGSSSQQLLLRDSRSHRHSSNNSENSSSRTSFASAESGLMRQFNMDGIAEVLLALERIEQDEELTHEQILALETSLFLSGLNLYDQHRDMRLDIDNMSYEELLALEERMGSVSTALSEEALSKCLMRSIYEATPSTGELTESGKDVDNNKCSICQEEYITGDEIGDLVGCRHGYHATCINQWLQQKNWCPVCKASAAPPP